MSIEQSYKKFQTIKDKTFNHMIDVLKHFVSISGVLLAILISFNSNPTNKATLFYCVLYCLIICIFSGTIGLYIFDTIKEN
ncbi:hypothetical protein [Kordia sp.]|uniref:hypothetical protein n=1 Tax=Kordia sp. TaxID=1965332 RepID=UPI003D6C58C5